MRGLIYVVFLLFLTGCAASGSAPEELDEAGRLMRSDPGAALSKLNGLDVSEFSDSSTMARWALLYSEALVANRLTAPTDTIVDIAVDYYARHNLTDEFQRASRLKALIRSTGDRDELATALYLQKEKEFMLYRERVKHQRYMYGALLLLIVSAGVIAVMRQRLRVQALRTYALMSEASGLKSEIDAGKCEVVRLESKLRGMLENRFALVDTLCQTYYETQGTKTERKAIVDKVRSTIESVRTDSFPELEQAVNDCRDNLLVKVTQLWPEIKPADYQLLVYLASGLSTRTVCLLLGETVEVVYKRKSRLKSRIAENVAACCPDVWAVF